MCASGSRTIPLCSRIESAWTRSVAPRNCRFNCKAVQSPCLQACARIELWAVRRNCRGGHGGRSFQSGNVTETGGRGGRLLQLRLLSDLDGHCTKIESNDVSLACDSRRKHKPWDASPGSSTNKRGRSPRQRAKACN